MLIDDSRIDNHVNEKMLRYNRFAANIEVFNRAWKAMSRLHEIGDQNAIERCPEIIFLDWKMPVIDGEGFITSFQRLPGFIQDKARIVLLSAYLDNKKMKFVQDRFSNIYKVVEKPLMKNDLTSLDPKTVS